jgi:integrase
MVEVRGEDSSSNFSSVGSQNAFTERAQSSQTLCPQKESQPIKCPKCGPKTKTVWRDGTYTSMFGSQIQRWLCRRCGLRFSDPQDVEAAKKLLKDDLSIDTKELKSDHGIIVSRQICAEVKNLVAEQQVTDVLRKETFDINSTLAKYEWYLQKEGRRIATIRGRTKLLKILWRRNADFHDPESVKTVISKQTTWCEGRKANAVDAYSSYLAMVGGTWTPPTYKSIPKLPFVPKETEIDQLIAGLSIRVGTFVQLIKETHARPGEIWHSSEDNFDFETNTVNITPEKNSNPRIFKMSPKLVGMLHNLPRPYGKYYFSLPEMSLDNFRDNYDQQRNRIAEKLHNPRLKKIMFKTLRTWGGTMDYHRTKDVLYVMNRLGHKNIKNTLIYIQLEEALFKDEIDYISKVAKTEAEACILIESGFDFVCDFDGHKLFRMKNLS